MQRKLQKLPSPLPEVFVSSSATTKAVSRLVQAAGARKIGPRLYTTNMIDPPATIVRRNLWPVVGLLMPGAVIGYRTAFESTIPADGAVFLAGPYRRRIELPGVRIQMLPGPGPLEGDQPFVGGIYIASRARAILESLKLTRQRKYASRGLSRKSVEEWLERELRIGSEARINQVRDDARRLAPLLDARPAFETLDSLVGALLGTRRARMTSPVAIARAAGTPYDPARLELFDTLHGELLRWHTRGRPDRLPSDDDFVHLAFFDAYFSNFIEGTEFEIADAHAIVFEGQFPWARPEDAHDILGTYQLVGNRHWMSRGMRDAESVDAFIVRIKAAHAEMMSARPGMHPGQFKTTANKAGLTTFVPPELVSETLRKGVELARSLSSPFERATMLMFVLSEVHPFDDGNGRIARAFMNAELVAGGERRILVPTVYRNEYLTGLRTLSRTAHPTAYLQIMDFAQEYTARIDFTNYEHALSVLTATNAFAEPETTGRDAAADSVAKLRLPAPAAS